MRKLLRYALLICLVLVLGSIVAFSAEKKVTLKLDGDIIITDVPPLIENGRTLVPYRALLEAMGGNVFWEPEAKMATAVLGDRKVQVTINNTSGFVNGRVQMMDVPPRIIDGRTMIPLRFVMENLNCKVDWEDISRTVIVTSPEADECIAVEEIYLEEGKDCYRIVVRADTEIIEVSSFAYEEPFRFGVDVKNAVYHEKSGSITAENDVIRGVRFSQFDNNTVRIVVDLNNKVAGRINLSPERSSIYIDFMRPETESEQSRGDWERWEVTVDLPKLDWRVSGKLIVLDPGHGGKDPGAEGKRNGAHAVWEKDLNLSVALHVYDLLQQAGANVVLLREKDVSMGLYERPEAANLMGGDLYISIHHNAAEVPKPCGTEVLYFSKDGEDKYGLSSRTISSYIHAEMVSATGLNDRGIKSAPHLAVLNKSLMPAVIIEGGFLSNPSDLEIILSKGFAEAYAGAVAKGVINALNASLEE